MALSIAPALHRGLTVLEMLSQADQSVGFNQIADRLGISKSSVARILRVLRDRGYTDRSPQTGRYMPGPRMANLGQRTPLIDRMRDFGNPILDSLTGIAENTSMLLYWDGHQVQSLAKKNHPTSIAMYEVGLMSGQLLNSPWGWMFYQLLPLEQQKQAKQREAANPDIIVSTAYLKSQYEQILEKGYMLDDQQIYTWIRRLASPVYDHHQKVVGAIALGGNILTIPDPQIEVLGKHVQSHALKLSLQLGATALEVA